MMRLSLSLLGLAIGVSATFIDPNTGITFENYVDPKGYSFGIALPETPTTDFIGQLIIPTTGTGYGGLTLTGKMTSSLLIVAWPNGDDVVASFRYATSHTAPVAYSAAYAPNATLSMTPIANGTFVNSTHLSYTYLCARCITGDSLSFAANASSITLGWSLSANAVTTPESAVNATLKFHNTGYGSFDLDLENAKSADYVKWAAEASNSTDK